MFKISPRSLSVIMLAALGWECLAAAALANATGLPAALPTTSGNYDGPAELPRISFATTLSDTPAPGITWSAATSAELRQALSQARCGDTVLLQAGATFIGSFVLPAQTCDDQHWIILRSSAPDTSLPPEGTRITPCYAGVSSLPGRPSFDCTNTQTVMAKLVAFKVGPITLAAGASHYRLGPGLEITRRVVRRLNFGLIVKEKNVPADHIIIDRDWVHGTAQDDTTRGINLSGITYAAVVDSYFTDFHCMAGIGACVDSQAISGGSGTVAMGIWKIDNNFLEAAAENILFGGSAGTMVPTDIAIQHNHLFKPLTWMPGQPGFVGGVNPRATRCRKFHTPGYCPFIVKNLFELKNAQRLLFEGNVLENVWGGFTQHGFGIVLAPLSQGGTTGNPNATVADITIRYNQISDTASGLVIAEVAYQWGPPKLEARLSIHDDVFDNISPLYNNRDRTAVQVAFEVEFCSTCSPLQDVFINHITMLVQSPRVFLLLGAPTDSPIQSLSFTNNLVSSPSRLAINGIGSNAPCAFSGSTELARINNCTSLSSFVANALIGATGSWPSNNFYPPTPQDVQFLNYGASDIEGDQLSSSSPYKNAGTDGMDLGANIEAVVAAIAGAL
jgi:hypothetical protein